MNANPTRTLFISLGAGIFAMFLVYSYSQEKRAEYDKLYGTTKRVVVATQDILEMSTIDDTMVEYKEIPVNFIQPGAITNPEDAVNMIAATPIQEGEQILATKLLSPGPITGLSHQVAPNKRAVTISIDEVRGVGKLLRPGDRVDILATLESGTAKNRKTEVKTIMQDVVILATGTHITNNIPRSLEVSGGDAYYRNLNGDTSFSTITLEVTPKEAQDLVFLQVNSPGGIYLTLRNTVDRSNRRTASSNINSLLGKVSIPRPRPIRQAAVPPPPQPRPLPPKRATKRNNNSLFKEVN